MSIGFAGPGTLGIISKGKFLKQVYETDTIFGWKLYRRRIQEDLCLKIKKIKYLFNKLVLNFSLMYHGLDKLGTQKVT